RAALISQLARLLDSEATLTASALKQNNLARHREVLADHRAELRRLAAAIAAARDRANLLSTVRSDIDAYRSASSAATAAAADGRSPAHAEADYMLDERARLDSSHSLIDRTLSQAYAVNESFLLQRETLGRINRRIVGAAGQIPGVNALIGRISAKRRRDGIILGTFIGFCLLMLFLFR
ncbi:hypothetical protein KEM52_004974, partial [Ascosphaera acerosa]